jgi:hypothetical protein
VTLFTPFLNYYFSSVHTASTVSRLTPSRHLTTRSRSLDSLPVFDSEFPSLYHTDLSRSCRRMRLASRQRHLKRVLLSFNTAMSYFKVCSGHISTCSLTELIGPNFVAHDVGWIITSFFTIVATVASFWLINKHLQWYTVVRSLSARFPSPLSPARTRSDIYTSHAETRATLYVIYSCRIVCGMRRFAR